MILSVDVDVQLSESAGIAAADAKALNAHLSQCALHASTDATISGTITVRLVGREESAQLNLRFRQKDTATNVLSFPYATHDLDVHSQALASEQQPLGDLVICAPVVSEEAQQQGKTEYAHYAHMVIHGVLHLLGFDHIQDEEAQRMEALETQLLGQLGVNNPYQNSAA